MKWLDKRYYSVYLVLAIIGACFIFMFVSTVAVFEKVGKGKTSLDLALEDAKKKCDTKNGELVQVNKNNPLNTACIVNVPDGHSKN